MLSLIAGLHWIAHAAPPDAIVALSIGTGRATAGRPRVGGDPAGGASSCLLLPDIRLGQLQSQLVDVVAVNLREARSFVGEALFVHDSLKMVYILERLHFLFCHRRFAQPLTAGENAKPVPTEGILHREHPGLFQSDVVAVSTEAGVDRDGY